MKIPEAGTDANEERPRPRLTIVIPIYNEEAILHAAVIDLIDRLAELDGSFAGDAPDYQLLLAENGSRDATVEIAQELAERFAQVSTFSVGEPNYGMALRRGIIEARGHVVICDEIDLCDTDFYERALQVLDGGGADLVVGSKLLDASSDERPFLRHFASQVINGMLRIALGFKGTDTHGLKAMRRDAMIETVQRCVIDKDLFASEMVIRAERGGVATREIPVRVLEKRPPSIHLFRRVPAVLRGIAKLFIAIRLRG